MEQQPENTSVIIVSRYSGEALWHSIKSVLAQPGLCELVLVDIGNTKDFKEKLEELASKAPIITLLTPEEKTSLAGGYNLGVDQAKGEYVLLLGADSILPDHGISRLVSKFRKHPEAWVAGCHIVNADQEESQAQTTRLLTAKQYLFGAEARVLKEPSFVSAVSGKTMLMKRETYWSAGGMDEDYFLHYADMDFCLQVTEMEGKILYLPEVSVLHFEGDGKSDSLLSRWHRSNDLVRYFSKNFAGSYATGMMLLLALYIYARFLAEVLYSKFRS